MNGFRVMGSRKTKMIDGPLNKQMKRLGKQGINARAYLKAKWGINKIEDFKNIATKRI